MSRMRTGQPIVASRTMRELRSSLDCYGHANCMRHSLGSAALPPTEVERIPRAFAWAFGDCDSLAYRPRVYHGSRGSLRLLASLFTGWTRASRGLAFV
jgi:hypothetical protein